MFEYLWKSLRLIRSRTFISYKSIRHICTTAGGQISFGWSNLNVVLNLCSRELLLCEQPTLSYWSWKTCDPVSLHSKISGSFYSKAKQQSQSQLKCISDSGRNFSYLHILLINCFCLISHSVVLSYSSHGKVADGSALLMGSGMMKH